MEQNNNFNEPQIYKSTIEKSPSSTDRTSIGDHQEKEKFDVTTINNNNLIDERTSMFTTTFDDEAGPDGEKHLFNIKCKKSMQLFINLVIITNFIILIFLVTSLKCPEHVDIDLSNATSISAAINLKKCQVYRSFGHCQFGEMNHLFFHYKKICLNL